MSEPASLQLSPFAQVEWQGANVVVRSRLHAGELASEGAAVLLVMHAFAEPRSMEEVGMELAEFMDADETLAIITELVELRVLVDTLPHSVWEPLDLAYHTASTVIPPGVKRAVPNATAPVRAPREGAIALPRDAGSESPSLWRLLHERRSAHGFGSSPIALSTLAELLQRSAADRGPPRDGVVHRPYPSGGATYSLELYPAIPSGRVDGLPGGTYHYHAGDHAIAALSKDEESARYFAETALTMMGASGELPVVILITSRFSRVSAGYSKIAYRLVLLEVGCLMQTFQLVAASLGLGVCPLGGIPSADTLARLGGFDPLEEPLVAAIAVGPAVS